MARGRVKQKEGEDFSEATILRVKEALENGTTKKDACAMLNIAYNTTRLNKIIEQYDENKAYRAERRKALRGKPISDVEKASMVKMYLEGESLTSISDSTFRSTAVVKNVLRAYNVPLRDASNTYHNPVFIDFDPTELYEPGDLVYSARYNCPAYIEDYMGEHKEHGAYYRIYLVGDHSQYAVQPYYELADLTRAQKELGISIEYLTGDEIKLLRYEAALKAKKLANKK